jgi:hypothetical protein
MAVNDKRSKYALANRDDRHSEMDFDCYLFSVYSDLETKIRRKYESIGINKNPY